MDQNVKDLLDTVNFIKDYMVTHMLTKEEGVTKDDLPKLVRPIIREELSTALKPIEDRLTSVESKIAGTNRRLDTEAMHRDDLALPKRVSNLEEKTFGASRHPAHVPLK
jgi:hypothetical protein